MAPTTTAADIIIIGGGIGGCVLASSLHSKNPELAITLIEAGLDVSSHEVVLDPRQTVALRHTELDWDHLTVPQVHLDGRRCYAAAGKALGGGSAVNNCMCAECIVVVGA